MNGFDRAHGSVGDMCLAAARPGSWNQEILDLLQPWLPALVFHGSEMNLRAVLIWMLNRKQKTYQKASSAFKIPESELCFCFFSKTKAELAFWYVLLDFIHSELLQSKQNRKRFVPVTFEFVTICDICDQNVTKSVLLDN